MDILAIDIGGTKVATALIDENLNIKDRKQFATLPNHTIESYAQFLTDIIHNYDVEAYEGVAIGTTGTVYNGVLTALTPASLGNLNTFPLIEVVKKATNDKPVLALNDAQAATWAEYINSKIPNMCFITVSTGVGGGFILNDDLHTGHTNLAGHVGHTLIKAKSPIRQVYGDYCILENICSGTAIAAFTKDWEKPLTTAEVFEGQLNGCEKCSAIVDQVTTELANLIANLVVTNDIHDFFLGGSVSLNTSLIPQIQAKLDTFPPQYHARLHPAEWGQDAGLAGAAHYYFNRFLQK